MQKSVLRDSKRDEWLAFSHCRLTLYDCHDRLQKIFMVEKTSVGCKVRCKYPPCLTVALTKLSQQPAFTRGTMLRAYFHLNILNDPDWEHGTGECRGQDVRAYLLLSVSQFDL